MKLAKQHPSICFLALLFCGLIGCTLAEHQEVYTTPGPAIALTSTTAIAQTDPTLVLEATSISRPSSRTPSPSGDDSLLYSPFQPEPTATPTVAPPTPPTPSPTVTPMSTSTEVEGWLTYKNDFLGYRFSYPPQAIVDHHDVIELPENLTDEEYLAYLESNFPIDLCAGVSYRTGFVAIYPSGDTLASYSTPCGITGIGDQRIEQWQEAITIGGESHMASAYRLYNRQTDQFEMEFYILIDVNNNLRIDFGAHKAGTPRSAQPRLSEQEFNEVLETLRRIVESLRF